MDLVRFKKINLGTRLLHRPSKAVPFEDYGKMIADQTSWFLTLLVAARIVEIVRHCS